MWDRHGAVDMPLNHAHEGKLWAEANEPRGAVFQFTLPGTDGELTSPLQVDRRTSELCKRIG